MKTILVFYIDVRNIDPHQVHDMISTIATQFEQTHAKENILAYYIPVSRESSIEKLRGKPDVQRALDMIQREVIEWSKSLPHKSRHAKRRLNQPDI